MCPERTPDWLAEAGGFEPLHFDPLLSIMG
jgi:hypothetical protein